MWMGYFTKKYSFSFTFVRQHGNAIITLYKKRGLNILQRSHIVADFHKCIWILIWNKHSPILNETKLVGQISGGRWVNGLNMACHANAWRPTLWMYLSGPAELLFERIWPWNTFAIYPPSSGVLSVDGIRIYLFFSFMHDEMCFFSQELWLTLTEKLFSGHH